MGRKITNLIGKKFNKLTAIKQVERSPISKSSAAFWEFICECGNIVIKSGIEVKRGKVKSCGCLSKGSNNSQWKGHESIWGKTLSHYRYLAKQRDILFNVSIEYLWEQYLKQNKICPYTGINLVLESKSSISRTPTNASLDRIDSKKDYIEGNVQWVYKKINILKNSLSHNEFIEICNIVAKHCPYKKEQPVNTNS